MAIFEKLKTVLLKQNLRLESAKFCLNMRLHATGFYYFFIEVGIFNVQLEKTWKDVMNAIFCFHVQGQVTVNNYFAAVPGR